MKHLEGLLDLADKEFSEMEQNGKFRNKDDIELACKLVDMVKDIHCVWDYENKMENGYSEYSEYPINSYENGNSYARGRNMSRNSRGQFTSREGSYNYGYAGRNSYRGGNYSRADAKADFVDQLYGIMESAPDERTRERVQKMIREMEQQ